MYQMKGLQQEIYFHRQRSGFLQRKGILNEPQRCTDCRVVRKQKYSGGYGRTEREMFPAVCS